MASFPRRPAASGGAALALGLVLAAGGAAAAGCAPGGGGPAAGGGPTAGGAPDAAVRAAVEDPAVLTPDRPLTLRLTLPAELARRVRAVPEGGAPDLPLRLTVRGVEPPPVGANVRVFLNRPDADRETPTDAAGYLGEASFFPLGAGTPDEPRAFLFDAGQVFARLRPGARLEDGRELTVTLVLVPPAGAAPEGAGPLEVRVAGVELESVEPPPDPPQPR